MTGRAWRVRLTGWRVRLAGLAAAGGFLAIALGIRFLASGDGVLDSSGALQQHSGTALYASMVYAGVFVLVPRATPVVAGAAAVGFCWLVELLQLTGIPAALSERSVIARLVLGVQFDATDLAWYPVGVLPLVLIHFGVERWRRHRRDRHPAGPA
jgi:hypothetical protein